MDVSSLGGLGGSGGGGTLGGSGSTSSGKGSSSSTTLFGDYSLGDPAPNYFAPLIVAVSILGVVLIIGALILKGAK